MLLRLQSEGIAVDTWVWVAGVVVEWLNLVEVLAWLVGETVLSVENQTELSQRTNLDVTVGHGLRRTVLSPVGVSVRKTVSRE